MEQLSFEQLQFIKTEHDQLTRACDEHYNVNTSENLISLAIARSTISEFIYTIEKLLKSYSIVIFIQTFYPKLNTQLHSTKINL